MVRFHLYCWVFFVKESIVDTVCSQQSAAAAQYIFLYESLRSGWRQDKMGWASSGWNSFGCTCCNLFKTPLEIFSLLLSSSYSIALLLADSLDAVPVTCSHLRVKVLALTRKLISPPSLCCTILNRRGTGRTDPEHVTLFISITRKSSHFANINFHILK